MNSSRVKPILKSKIENISYRFTSSLRHTLQLENSCDFVTVGVIAVMTRRVDNGRVKSSTSIISTTVVKLLLLSPTGSTCWDRGI